MAAPADPRVPPAEARPQLLLQVPPFPGARLRHFEQVGVNADPPQPAMEEGALLVRSAASIPDELRNRYDGLTLWPDAPGPAGIAEPCDPWHMLDRAQAVVLHPDDPVRPIGAILDVPTHLIDSSGCEMQFDTDARRAVLADALPVAAMFANPFGGAPMTLADVIELCGFWRALIDSNRAIDGGVGFAFWKQDSVLPLLWNGGNARDFFRTTATETPDGAIAICTVSPPPCSPSTTSRSRTSARLSTMASVSAKPSAKSSRSSGVASITACEMPLYSSAIGTSSATPSSAGRAAPRRTGTRRVPAGMESDRSAGFMPASLAPVPLTCR